MFIEPPPETDDVVKLRLWCHKLQQKLLEDDLSGSATWDPTSLDDDDSVGDHSDSVNVTVTGAVVGDYAIASFSNSVQDLQLDAQITSANTVTCTLNNATNTTRDLASGTVYVRVFRRTT